MLSKPSLRPLCLDKDEDLFLQSSAHLEALGAASQLCAVPAALCLVQVQLHQPSGCLPCRRHAPKS